jgi:predicted nucleotidyltransferase
MNSKEMALNNLVYKIRTGSKLYGTNVEKSDDDFLGIFIPNKEYVMGLYKCDQVLLNTKSNSGEAVDYTIYSLPKFFKLAIDNNPNIIEMFFAPQSQHFLKEELSPWNEIIEKAYPLFISKKAYHTFKGYAYSQKIKMQNKDEARIIGKRKELYTKYGYDTKFASHLIRLLLEGLELLVEGKITFPLSQNTLIRDIRYGKYTIEEVIKKADGIEKLVDEAYVKSSLQHSADIKKINKLQIDILEDFYNIDFA